MGLARVSKNFFVSLMATYYVEFFRNVPLIVQMFFIYFSFTLTDTFPFLESFGNFLGLENHNEFFSALIALITYTSTYIAEAIRGGIQSLPKGQVEAAKTLGMGYFQTMYHIIFPQAIKIVWSPITGQFLNLIKNSSLAMTIGVAELTFATQEIDSITFRGFEAATAVTLLYLLLTLVTSMIMKQVDSYLLVKTASVEGGQR
jgi:polar amino acid transport system permease protein